MAHREGAGVGHGDEHVVLAAVDLHLVLVKAVRQVARLGRQRQVDRRRVELERAVRHRQRILRVGQFRLLPHRRQGRHHGAVEFALDHVFRLGIGNPVSAREFAVQVIETAVLAVQYHHGLDLRDPCGLLRCLGSEGGKGGKRGEGEQGGAGEFHSGTVKRWTPIISLFGATDMLVCHAITRRSSPKSGGARAKKWAPRMREEDESSDVRRKTVVLGARGAPILRRPFTRRTNPKSRHRAQ